MPSSTLTRLELVRALHDKIARWLADLNEAAKEIDPDQDAEDDRSQCPDFDPFYAQLARARMLAWADGDISDLITLALQPDDNVGEMLFLPDGDWDRLVDAKDVEHILETSSSAAEMRDRLEAAQQPWPRPEPTKAQSA